MLVHIGAGDEALLQKARDAGLKASRPDSFNVTEGAIMCIESSIKRSHATLIKLPASM